MRRLLEIATRPEVSLVLSLWLIVSAVVIVLTGGSFIFAGCLMFLAGMI